MIRSYSRILKNRNFFFLWVGQILSQFGDKLTQIALVGLVGSLLKTSSASHLAIIFSMTIIPVVLFSPITGVYIDRWSKRKTMYICDFLRGAFILLIPLLFLKVQYFPLICIIIFLSSSAGRFFIPAKMAFVPHIIEKKDIFLANSLISITATSAAVFGLGLGGFWVDHFGLNTAFYIDAVTFFISALSIFLIASKEKEHFLAADFFHIGKDVVDTVKKSFIQELKEGIKYIFNSHETKYAFKVFFFLFSYIGGLSTVFITYIQGTLGSAGENVKHVGIIGLSAGFGILIGSLAYGRLAHKFSVKKVMNGSTLIASLFLIFFAVSVRAYPNPIYAGILSSVLGLIISPIFIGVNSLIHKESDKDLLGRIFSSLEFVSHLGFLLSMFIFARLADIFGSFIIILTIGIIGFLFSLLFSLKDD